MWIVRALTFLLVVYCVITLAAWIYAERVIFQPPPASYDRDTLPFVPVPVGDGDSVAVLHLRHPEARFTVLFSHGNAEDLGYARASLERIRDAGFSVLAYDYRGYGRSSGRRPSASRAVEDAEAVYRYAVEGLGIAPDRLILHGRSVGSGPTMALADRHPSAAVVLESPFTSAYRVMTRVRLLPFDRFPNLERARRLDRPLLVIHGTDDIIIPAAHGRAIHDAAPGPKRALWVEGAGHNDLLAIAGDRYGEALREMRALLEGGVDR